MGPSDNNEEVAKCLVPTNVNAAMRSSMNLGDMLRHTGSLMVSMRPGAAVLIVVETTLNTTRRLMKKNDPIPAVRVHWLLVELAVPEE